MNRNLAILATMAMTLEPFPRLEDESDSVEAFFDEFFGDLFKERTMTKQVRLNGVQRKMKRFRNMSLKQALGDLNGARQASLKRKALKKQARILLLKEVA